MGNGKERDEFSEVYPKMKIHRVMNGFQVIAYNNVFIYNDDERGRKQLFDFFCDWVAKQSIEKKQVADVVTPLTTETTVRPAQPVGTVQPKPTAQVKQTQSGAYSPNKPQGGKVKQ